METLLDFNELFFFTSIIFSMGNLLFNVCRGHVFNMKLHLCFAGHRIETICFYFVSCTVAIYLKLDPLIRSLRSNETPVRSREYLANHIRRKKTAYALA